MHKQPDNFANTSPRVSDSTAMQPSKEPEPPRWAFPLRNPTGSSSARNIPRAELLAVESWVADLEADLAEPPGAREHFILGSIGRHTLLNMRLSREVFRSTRTKGGEIKQSVGELRQSTRLIVELLGRLRFKTGRAAVPPPDLRDQWSSE